jgi:hypothetical protein
MEIDMTENSTNRPAEYDRSAPTSWTNLGQDLWSYLTGRGAAINYRFVDMTIQVPRDTGVDAPQATWKLNGTLRITTSDDEFKGANAPRG